MFWCEETDTKGVKQNQDHFFECWAANTVGNRTAQVEGRAQLVPGDEDGEQVALVQESH